MRQLKAGFLLLAAVLIAGLSGGCSTAGDTPTISPTIRPTISPTIQGSPGPATSVTGTVSPSSATTIQSAEAYIQSLASDAGGPFEFIGVDTSWRTASTLHAIHATPTTSASYGGDDYFFFVNGQPVGRFFFTGSVGDRAPDATSYAVMYRVYQPGDPHCCPTGGTATTTFRWDGSKLTHDPTPGATQN